jgi:hypothetical protein
MWDKNFLSRLLSGLHHAPEPVRGPGKFGYHLMTGSWAMPHCRRRAFEPAFLILSVVQFGVSSGASIFTAQFWGNRDREVC